MEGLNVQVTTVGSQPRSGLSKVTNLFIGIPVLVIFLPIVLLIIIFGVISNILNRFSPRSKAIDPRLPRIIFADSQLTISCVWADADEIPDVLNAYFDPESNTLMMLKSEPENPFFEGYFTSFKIERSDGVFIQKVELNNAGDEIVAIPLYFFNYKNQQLEMIRDLKGYEIDAKGGVDNFIIEAYNEEEVLEIHIKK